MLIPLPNPVLVAGDIVCIFEFAGSAHLVPNSRSLVLYNPISGSYMLRGFGDKKAVPLILKVPYECIAQNYQRCPMELVTLKDLFQRLHSEIPG